MVVSHPLLRPLLIGHLLSWLLMGILSVQVYIYHSLFTKDSKATKSLVYLVFILETVQTAFITETAIHVFADSYGDFTVLNEIGTIWITVPLMNSLPAFISQMFYSYRVKVLSQSKLLPIIILLLSLSQLVSGLAVTIMGKKAGFISNLFSGRIILVNTISNASNVLCDIIIAVTLTYYLSRGRSGIRQTEDLLSRLIRLVIGTGSLTAIITIMNLVFLVLANDHQFFFVITGGILGKLYSNSILVVLNSRPSSSVPEQSTDLVLSTGSLHVSVPLSGQWELGSRGSRRNSGQNATRLVSFPSGNLAADK